ncbi:transposase [Desulfogranum mediterraneum]|uniref:transposase n=1 Tax=Desulfogranum mediterraneum TaxID=160661 RepID=UPI000A036942|nr:transposase [Desulfogranum mediterraneum]
MPRANRHFIPGQIWHITHRCHKRDFLLKFDKDRRAWTQWLHEAKLRFNLVVFNWIVTSNHIHLLLLDETGQEVIPRSIQLIAGRTAQGYNQRKRRKGAFWEDRYHATAIEAGSHLLRCLIYINLNMVRAGVVIHPSEWPFGGYNEIQSSGRGGGIIAHEKLAAFTGFQSYETFKSAHNAWVNEALENGDNARQSEWSESIGVGSKTFTLWIKEKLGIRAKGRSVMKSKGDGYHLREPTPCYNNNDDYLSYQESLKFQNCYFWELYEDATG